MLLFHLNVKVTLCSIKFSSSNWQQCLPSLTEKALILLSGTVRSFFVVHVKIHLLIPLKTNRHVIYCLAKREGKL